MVNRPPGVQVGYTAAQRAAIQAVEEEAILETITEFLRKANSLGNRIEAFAAGRVQDSRNERSGEP